MPLGSNHGFYIIDAAEMFAGIGDLQEFEIGSHAIQLHREIFRLHLDLEDLPQMANRLVSAKREECDFLTGIIGRGEEGKTLDVVPMKVCEHDHDLFLLVPDGEEVASQIAQSVPASMMAMRLVSVKVICRQVVLPPNC